MNIVNRNQFILGALETLQWSKPDMAKHFKVNRSTVIRWCQEGRFVPEAVIKETQTLLKRAMRGSSQATRAESRT